MKKIYMIMSAALLTVGMSAQQSQMISRSGVNGHNTNATSNYHPVQPTAAGDTLLWIPFLDIIVNQTDAPTFQYVTEDLDGFTCTTTNNWPSPDYAYFYSLDAWDYHPWETVGVDSSFFAAATSWFDNDPALSDDWMEMGPITVPAGGATLTWYVKTNPQWRDGYEVLTSTTGMSNYNDFSNPAIYSRADLYPSASEATDTVWAPVTAQVPAGTQYIAFHHNANGMDVLYLDEILLIENPQGINEHSDAFTLSQSFPNPANNNATFTYDLVKNADVTVNVVDVTGQTVYSSAENNQSAGSHRVDLNTADFANGMYFYTISVNGQTETQKFTVSHN